MIDLVDEMSSSSEVYKTATLLIDEYGEFAQTGAFIKADEMADKGDLVAHKTWLQVAKIVEDLLSTERPKNSVMH